MLLSLRLLKRLRVCNLHLCAYEEGNADLPAQPPFCLVSHSWRDYLQIESLCQSIYFPSNPVPAGSLTLLHGLLYFVVRDYLHEDDPDLAKFDASTYCKFCEDRFSAGLKSYEMMIDPTLEKIQTLLLGVCHLPSWQALLTGVGNKSTRRIQHPALLDISRIGVQHVSDLGIA